MTADNAMSPDAPAQDDWKSSLVADFKRGMSVSDLVVLYNREFDREYPNPDN